MKKKPWIGLVPLIDPERESLWMLPGYMEGVLAAGGIPVMLAAYRRKYEHSRTPGPSGRSYLYRRPTTFPPLFTEKHPSGVRTKHSGTGYNGKAAA